MRDAHSSAQFVEFPVAAHNKCAHCACLLRLRVDLSLFRHAGIAATLLGPLAKAALFGIGNNDQARVTLPRAQDKEPFLLSAVDQIARHLRERITPSAPTSPIHRQEMSPNAPRAGFEATATISMRLSGVQDDTAAPESVEWAVSRLTDGTGLQMGRPNILDRRDPGRRRRAAAQRNLAWMEARCLTREVTRQAQYRIWRVPVRGTARLPSGRGSGSSNSIEMRKRLHKL